MISFTFLDIIIVRGPKDSCRKVITGTNNLRHLFIGKETELASNDLSSQHQGDLLLSPLT